MNEGSSWKRGGFESGGRLSVQSISNEWGVWKHFCSGLFPMEVEFEVMAKVQRNNSRTNCHMIS